MNLTQIALDMISTLGYTGLFIGLVIDSFGIPIPSEVLVPLATALGLQGRFNLILVFTIAVIAQVLGALIGYYIGRYAGEPFLIKYGKYILISHRDLKRTQEAFEKHGTWFVMIGRCVPVIRGLIAYPAGIAEMPVARFVTFSALGSAIWTAILMGLGVVLQNNLELIDSIGKKFSILVALLIVAYIVWHFRHLLRPKGSKKDEAE